MEEIIEELKRLNNTEKKSIIKKLISERRKEILILISKKSICIKNDDIENLNLIRREIKNKKDEISILQNIKNNIVEVRRRSEKKKQKPQKEKPILTNEECDFLSSCISGNHINDLTNFDNIEISLLEHLLLLKQKYVIYKKNTNKKIKDIRKSIKILNEFKSEESLELNNLLNSNIKLRKILSKILKYLDKLIKIEFKKRNKLTREERRLIETLFADKFGVKESVPLKDYTTEELYSVYYELIFKDRDLNEITDLLEKYPDLYMLENNKKMFYELILDKYSNTLLNKNYIGNSQKAISNFEELEYYKKLIVKYLAYSFENDKLIIKDLTIKKIERILYILNKNNIYLERSNEILNQIKYFKEIIMLGSLNNNNEVKEINNEYIFSIDSDGTKIIEDALSIRKDSNNYYLNFYIPDLVSFIPRKSILDKKALDRYKNNKYAFPLDIVKFFNLNQGKKKRVIGYHFIYDQEGNIKKVNIEKNIIKLYNAYSFEQFNKLFLTDDKNANNIKELFELITNKKLDDINYSSSAVLSFLIQDAGKIIGKYLNNQNIMCLYKDVSNGEVHSVYQENDYVEFTSPIRSYISFLNQRILFETENIKELTEKCNIINQKTKRKKEDYEK